jgi:hypothetical protein
MEKPKPPMPTANTTETNPVPTPSGFAEDVLQTAVKNCLSNLDDKKVGRRLAAARTAREAGDELEAKLAANDLSVGEVIREAVKKAGALGAVTGTLGPVGQILDLPLFYVQAVKSVGSVAIEFGFDPRDHVEHLFIGHLIRIGHLPTEQQRDKELSSLSLETLTKRQDMRQEGAFTLLRRGLVSALPRLLPAGAKRLIPVAGALLNAKSDAQLMENILNVAGKAYSLRLQNIS